MHSNVVIVPTFGSASSQIISDFIERVNQQTLENLHIVVVNNNSYKLNVSVKNKKGKVYIINPGKNMGSAGGFFLGMKYAHEIIKEYQYMILADDDAIILDDNGLESLLLAASEKTIVRPFWKNLTDDSGTVLHASISCYGILSKDIISKLGYYNPVFFYGGEDGAYGIEIEKKHFNIKSLSSVGFYHPYKTFFSSSRGSSGLSTFRFNSILQHIYNIYFHKSIKSFFLVLVYLLSLFYFLFLDGYFRKRILANFRNLISYVPPIFSNSHKNLFYNMDNDEHIIGIDESSLSCDRFLITPPYNYVLGNKKNPYSSMLIIDSWFPVTNFLDLKYIVKRFVSSYKSIGFLHKFDFSNNMFYIKKIIGFHSNIQKYLYIASRILLFPIFCIFSFVFFLFVLIKYLGYFCYFDLMNNRLFRKYTRDISTL